MVLGDSVLFHTNGTFALVYPNHDKYTERELQEMVGGAFYIVHTNSMDKCFVVCSEDAQEAAYNINANYLFRRLVEDVIILRGQVLLCNCNLIDAAVIANLTNLSQKEEKAQKLLSKQLF